MLSELNWLVHDDCRFLNFASITVNHIILVELIALEVPLQQIGNRDSLADCLVKLQNKIYTFLFFASLRITAFADDLGYYFVSEEPIYFFS